MWWMPLSASNTRMRTAYWWVGPRDAVRDRVACSKICHFSFLAHVPLKLLVSLISRLIACSARIVVDRPTDKQTHRTTTVILAAHAHRGLKRLQACSQSPPQPIVLPQSPTPVELIVFHRIIIVWLRSTKKTLYNVCDNRPQLRVLKARQLQITASFYSR